MGIIKRKLNKVVERYARKLAPLTTIVPDENDDESMKREIVL